MGDGRTVHLVREYRTITINSVSMRATLCSPLGEDEPRALSLNRLCGRFSLAYLF